MSDPRDVRSPRRVLVTGATGFLGRRLCARLAAAGVDTVALARRPAPGPWRRFVACDLGAGAPDPAAFEGVEAVFHLAARVHALAERRPREDDYRRANANATRAVALAAARAGARVVVHASSVKAMGEGGEECLDETAVPHPADPYGRSKLEAERFLAGIAAEHGLAAASLRLPLLHGAGAKGNLARMLDAVARGRLPALPETGNRRSVLHVADAADALWVAACRVARPDALYLAADPRPYSSAEIVARMRAALGRAPARRPVPRVALHAAAVAGDVAAALLGRRVGFDREALGKLLGSACYDPGRIARELGFRATRGLDAGLAEMVAERRGRGR